MKRQGFPFAAVLGMEKAKEAVTMALVNPRAGGLLISGAKGTGKSTLARGARELTDAPWTEVPVSVTEDRLFGSIDAEAAVKLGQRKLQPGLVDEAKLSTAVLSPLPAWTRAASKERFLVTATAAGSAYGGPGGAMSAPSAMNCCVSMLRDTACRRSSSASIRAIVSLNTSTRIARCR